MVKFKINKPTFKKLNRTAAIKAAVAVAVIVLVVLLGMAIGSHWQTQKHNKAVEASKVAAAQKAKDDEYKKATSQYKLYVSAYETERVNCEKGASLYANTLTPAQKLTAQKNKSVPTCGAAVPRP